MTYTTREEKSFVTDSGLYINAYYEESELEKVEVSEDGEVLKVLHAGEVEDLWLVLSKILGKSTKPAFPINPYLPPSPNTTPPWTQPVVTWNEGNPTTTT